MLHMQYITAYDSCVLCIYVCMCVCERGVPQNIIIITIIIIISISIISIITITTTTIIIIFFSRSSFFKYGTWWSTTVFYWPHFQTYLYGRFCVHICYIYIDTKIAGIQHLHFLLSHHITLDFAAFGHKQLARYVFPRCSKSISRVIPNGKQDMWQSTQHQQLLCLGSKPLGVKHLAIL